MPLSRAISLAFACSSSMFTARCAARCSRTKSVSSRSTSGNAPFFGPRKLFLRPLHAKRTSFCFRQPRMLRPFTPNCRSAAQLPMVSAAEITFLLKAAEYCLRGPDML
uniref:Putative secreted protein n=1 Tax=Ixodes ricinus TaxID=34613 RepID=A0A6B0UHW1_IXORI